MRRSKFKENQMKEAIEAKRNAMQALGVKAWFQYAKDHDLLLTKKQLVKIRKKMNSTYYNTDNGRVEHIPVLHVYGVDQSLLHAPDNSDDSDFNSIHKPLEYFKYQEHWFNLGKCKLKPYGYNPKSKPKLMAWYCYLSAWLDAVPDIIMKNDYRIQFKATVPGQAEYLQWDDGDDAFTRYMTLEQLKQMPNIKLDGTYED
jgi:hypothetical protein